MSSYTDLKAKRTEAVAPRSLFGTVAEIKDKEAQNGVKELKTPTQPSKPDKFARYRQSDADQIIKNMDDNYKNQKDKAKEAHENLREAESKAFNFHLRGGRNQIDLCKKSGPSPCNGNEVMLRRSNDNALEDEYGRLGLDLHADIRCLHLKEPPSNEKYQMLGNVLGKGGEFSYSGKEYATVGPHSMSSKSDSTSQSSVRTTSRPPSGPIPANLRHKYGNTVCSSVLEDAQLLIKEGVTPTDDKTTPTRSEAGTPCSRGGTGSASVEAGTLYDGLSNALRQDIFNGVPYSHLKSLNSSSYTSNGVHKTMQTYPPKFAVQRNEDSKWNEDMVIYQKLMKEWDAVMAERSKPSE